MLNIVTWYWGHKYPRDHVLKLVAGVERNLTQPHRIIVMSEQARIKYGGVVSLPIMDEHLIHQPGCVVRMRIFDPTWQASVGIMYDDRIVDLDIDAVITRPLDSLFDREEDFVILQGINTTNPCPYNGSVFMLRAGAHADVWNDFSLEANRAVPWHSFPDDQGWMHHKIPNGAAWTVADGIYGFKKKDWPSGDSLPTNARIVAFPGWRDPSMPIFAKIPWIKQHWRI